MQPGPVFLLQLVKPDGTIIRFPGGSQIERDLVDAIVRAVMERPVGMFRSQAQVELAVRDSVAQALHEFKQQSRAVVGKVD